MALFSIFLDCHNYCFVFSCTMFSIITVRAHTPVILLLFFLNLNIASCFEHNVFFMSGSVVEPSTLSSCFTWKTTKLNCVCAPKTPTDRAAVYSRNLQPHTSLLQLHRRLWSFDNGKLTCLSKMETIKPIKIIQSTSRVSKYSRTSLQEIFWGIDSLHQKLT